MTEAVETPAFVREEQDGSYSVVERASGTVLSAHTGASAWDTLCAALAAAIALPGFATATTTSDGTKRGYVPLRDAATRAEVGVWRWLDAGAAEDAPKPDGSRVTEGGIRSMAALLNADPEPKVIDGGVIPGLGPSGVHASLKDSGTLARGWAYVGVDWVDASGRTHLALWCEVFPEVDVAIDTGQLAFGSIGFGWNPDNPDDQVLIQHSLTNRPATSGLVPGSAMRADVLPGGRRFSRGALTRSSLMPTHITSKRGPAAEKLTQIQTMLGIPADAAQDDVVWAMHDALCALKQGATLETILAGGGAPALARAEGETDEAYAARMAKLKPAPVVAVARAVGGLEGPALEDWASQMLAIIQTLSAKADATAADALAWLTSAQDTIKGAMAAAAVPPAAGAAAPPGTPPENTAGYSRAQVIGLEASLTTARAEKATSDVRIADLEKKQARRDLQDVIAKRFVDAKLVLVDAARDELVEMCAGKPEAEQKKILDLALRANAAPPKGTAPSGETDPKTGKRAATTHSKFKTHDEALAHHQAAVRAEKPNASDREVFAEGYERARADIVLIDRGDDDVAEA